MPARDRSRAGRHTTTHTLPPSTLYTRCEYQSAMVSTTDVLRRPVPTPRLKPEPTARHGDETTWERQANWRKVAGESPAGRRSNQPLPPRVMGRHSRGCRLSVDRGAYGRGRLSYEKPEIQDAEAFQDAEGNTASTAMVRGKRTLRSRRTQTARTYAFTPGPGRTAGRPIVVMGTQRKGIVRNR